MSRIPIPPRAEALPQSKPLLETVERQLGLVPNLHNLLGLSPAVLEGFLAINASLGKTLDVGTRERVALAIAQLNGCDYCLSAHTWLGLNVASLDEAEVAKNRAGRSDDPKADAAVRFARDVAAHRGNISDEAIAAVRNSGFGDAEIVELVANVAVNVLTNYLNNVARTPIDFPPVYAEAA